jgi:hypothetical protein
MPRETIAERGSKVVGAARMTRLMLIEDLDQAATPHAFAVAERPIEVPEDRAHQPTLPR